MKFDDEPVPGYPLPILPGHVSPGRLERVLRSGAFAVTTELDPPDSADPEEVYARARIFDGCVDAINATDGAGAHCHMSSVAVSALLIRAGYAPVMQIACRDKNRIAIQGDILGGAAMGVCSMLCLTGDGVQAGAFFAPTLLLARDTSAQAAVHGVEAFGPVSTLVPYDDVDEAIALASYGRGSLVATLVTQDASVAAKVVPAIAAQHGRVHILDAQAAPESTGHGSPLPLLKHGGPGRAGGGEELGGLRAVKHYLQRAAVQGSPTMLAAVTGEHVRGAKVNESDVHPFKKWFEDLRVGDSLLTHRRTVSEADIVNFGGISGDYFYMHFDELAAKDTAFGKRIAHGYFVLSAAAGLFVYPGVGPVLANYGLDTLRFVKPVAIGDTIQARLTCKRKTDRNKRDEKGVGQGVVAWDVEVRNQSDELVASYDILTLVAKKG